jgi:hypothetical protein
MQDIDWDRVGAELDAYGCAVLPALLEPEQCAALTAGYGNDAQFRSRVVMERHGFGRGEYRYFAYPLPDELAHRAVSAAGAHRQPLERRARPG